MPDIMHQLKIHATPERVYDAIATAAGVRNWWTRDVVLEPTVGAVGEFGFYDRRFVAEVRVERLEPAKHVGWLPLGGPWTGTTISFDMRPDGSDTILAFAHRGFAGAGEDFARPNTRWGYYLLSLKSFLETGSGTPNPDDSDF